MTGGLEQVKYNCVYLRIYATYSLMCATVEDLLGDVDIIHHMLGGEHWT